MILGKLHNFSESQFLHPWHEDTRSSRLLELLWELSMAHQVKRLLSNLIVSSAWSTTVSWPVLVLLPRVSWLSPFSADQNPIIHPLKCHLNQGPSLIVPIKRTHAFLSFPTARNLYAISYTHQTQHSTHVSHTGGSPPTSRLWNQSGRMIPALEKKMRQSRKD